MLEENSAMMEMFSTVMDAQRNAKKRKAGNVTILVAGVSVLRSAVTDSTLDIISVMTETQ